MCIILGSLLIKPIKKQCKKLDRQNPATALFTVQLIGVVGLFAALIYEAGGAMLVFAGVDFTFELSWIIGMFWIAGGESLKVDSNATKEIFCLKPLTSEVKRARFSENNRVLWYECAKSK